MENDAEIFPAHYTWKVTEKGFKMASMMNKLAMINSCEIEVRTILVMHILLKNTVYPGGLGPMLCIFLLPQFTNVRNKIVFHSGQPFQRSQIFVGKPKSVP